MTDLIDLERLDAISHSNAAARVRVLADFRRMNTIDFGHLHKAAASGDFAEVELLAHRIKGAGMMLGAVQLGDKCSLVALACRSGDPLELQRAIGILDREYATLEAYIVVLNSGGQAPPLDFGIPVRQAPGRLLCTGLDFMVVDDHEFQLSVTVRLLQRLGANKVRSHSDSASALKEMTDGSTALDIVILDMSMPDMDGMELMMALSTKPHSCSLILNSALAPDLLEPLLQKARQYPLRVLGAAGKPLTEAGLDPLIRVYRAQPPGVELV